MTEELVTITKKEYLSLQEDRRWLICLESAGVDTWSWFDYARDMFDNLEEDEN